MLLACNIRNGQHGCRHELTVSASTKYEMAMRSLIRNISKKTDIWRTNSQAELLSPRLLQQNHAHFHGPFLPFLSNSSSIPVRSFSWWGSSKPSETMPAPSVDLTAMQDKLLEGQRGEFSSSPGNSQDFSVSIDKNFAGREEEILATPSKFQDLSQIKAQELGEITDNLFSTVITSESDWYSPIDAAVDAISWLHDVTGLPWWLSIVFSTFTLRMAILPLNIWQLKKVEEISIVLRKLPSPFPKRGSGITYIEQYKLFSKERHAKGCPSLFWMIASPLVQAPCFFVCLLAIRRMCLNHYPGFDNGGAFWFVDLTSLPHSYLGAILPLSVAGLHLLNVKISFNDLRNAKRPGIMGFLTKYFEKWLQFLTIPIFLTGLCIPQGSLIYWLSNNFLNTAQVLTFSRPMVRKRLGLRILPNVSYAGHLHDLSADELLALAAHHQANDNNDKAFQMLRVALAKDPERPHIYILMGKIFLAKEQWEEANKYFELAIQKANDNDMLITAYLAGGYALVRQGKKSEALAYFQKMASFNEPEDQLYKFQYNQGLVSLASLLSMKGRKDEAAVYLHQAAKYDPNVLNYLKEWSVETRTDGGIWVFNIAQQLN